MMKWTGASTEESSRVLSRQNCTVISKQALEKNGSARLKSENLLKHSLFFTFQAARLINICPQLFNCSHSIPEGWARNCRC